MCHETETIYDLINRLHSPEEQEKGVQLAIEYAKRSGDLSFLIMPPKEVPVWEQCANALKDFSDEELYPYLPLLLDWLYDLDWPGADIVFERMQRFSKRKIRKPLLQAIQRASDEQKKDRNGASKWLDHLNTLL